MNQNRYVSRLGVFIAAVSLTLAGCLAESEGEVFYEESVAEETAELRNQAAECGTKFECDCAAKGGYVRDGWLCCKDDGGGGRTCTNSPDLIISWLTANAETSSTTTTLGGSTMLAAPKSTMYLAP